MTSTHELDTTAADITMIAKAIATQLADLEDALNAASDHLQATEPDNMADFRAALDAVTTAATRLDGAYQIAKTIAGLPTPMATELRWQQAKARDARNAAARKEAALDAKYEHLGGDEADSVPSLPIGTPSAFEQALIDHVTKAGWDLTGLARSPFDRDLWLDGVPLADVAQDA